MGLLMTILGTTSNRPNTEIVIFQLVKEYLMYRYSAGEARVTLQTQYPTDIHSHVPTCSGTKILELSIM